MTRPARRLGATAAAIVVATGAALLPSSPALAVSRSCTIAYGYYGCSTSSIPANSVEHAILITTFRVRGGRTVTCRAHDAANGNQVGSVTNTSSWYSVDKTIRGLYGSYFLSCTQNGNRTSGNGGAISNG